MSKFPSSSLTPSGKRRSEEAAALTANAAADLLNRVTGFYHRTLFRDKAGLGFLASRNLVDPLMLETFQVGYCNGTLKSALPKSGEVIELLKALGILNANGNEVFYGRVTVPILDEAGCVVGLYGHKVEGDGAKLPEDSSEHLYLAEGHKAAFNASTVKTTERIIFTEAIFDALSFWQAGEHSVIALHGRGGWTEHHEWAVRESAAREIILALDNDRAGRESAESLRAKLDALLPTANVRTIAWPEGVKNANAFFSPGRENAVAQWMALVAPKPETAGEEKSQHSSDEPRQEVCAQGFALAWPNRRYEVIAAAKSGVTRLKATVKAIGSEPGRFHVEMFDLYSSRARRLFAAEAARVFRLLPTVTEADLGRLLVAAEHRCEQAGTGAEAPALSAQDTSEALKLGRSTDLAGEIQRDLGKLGIVGEETNRFLIYLAMTSRRMDDPLAVQILSSSGSGKSHLQDAVLSLCPEEDLIKLTSLSGQALFYKGEDSLRHKVLALEEVSGAEGARYAMRNLISAKKLTIETTVKNPETGRMETQVNTVHGPTAVFETTTQPDTDPETKSRYLLLSIDESLEQTRLIAEAQRHRHTMGALVAKKEREAVRRRHHTFQRMLRPLLVVNPYEPLLGYGDERLTTRRDQPKYLNLILAVAFLHQMQRPVRTHAILGDYIEVTLDDIAIANDLATELLRASFDDLSPPGRRLAGQLAAYVEARAHEAKWDKVDFGRRELREALKWSDTRLRVHLGELLRLEYLAPLCGGNGRAFRYRLLVAPVVLRSGGAFVPAMRSVQKLRKAVNLAAQETDPAGTQPLRDGEVKNGALASENAHRLGNPAFPGGDHIPIIGSDV